MSEKIAESAERLFPVLPLNWIDTGEIVDANLDLVQSIEDEGMGTLFAASPDLLEASKNARVILHSIRHAGEGGLDTIIADLDAAIAKGEGR